MQLQKEFEPIATNSLGWNMKWTNLEIHDMLEKPYDRTCSVIIGFDLKYLGNCDLKISSILGLDSGGIKGQLFSE